MHVLARTAILMVALLAGSAVEAANAFHYQLKVEDGAIGDVAFKIAKMANRKQRPVRTVFNGTALVAHPSPDAYRESAKAAARWSLKRGGSREDRDKMLQWFGPRSGRR